MDRNLKNRDGITYLGLIIEIALMLIFGGVIFQSGVLEEAKMVAKSVTFARMVEEIDMEIMGLQMDYYQDYETNSVYFWDPLDYAKNELKKGITTSTGATLFSDETGNLSYVDSSGMVMYASLDENGRIIVKDNAESDKAREKLLADLREE